MLSAFKFQFGWTVVRRTGESNPSGCKQPSNASQACPVPTPGVSSEAAPATRWLYQTFRMDLCDIHHNHQIPFLIWEADKCLVVNAEGRAREIAPCLLPPWPPLSASGDSDADTLYETGDRNAPRSAPLPPATSCSTSARTHAVIPSIPEPSSMNSTSAGVSVIPSHRSMTTVLGPANRGRTSLSVIPVTTSARPEG